jgi:hypothetical protein
MINYCETPGRFASEGGPHSSAQRRQALSLQPFAERRVAAMLNYCVRADSTTSFLAQLPTLSRANRQK